METKTCMESMLKRIEALESIVLPQKPARFIDNGDGTVTDTKTGLMWEKEGCKKSLIWNDAIASCNTLNLIKSRGYNDWRLPTIEELFSIVDYSRHDPAIDPVFECKSYGYWSSTTSAALPSYAWFVNFYSGYVNHFDKAYNYYVRAVRNIT